jgi:uncharacterized protein YabN with tetrapyrrole methylase and pyrophosphatase domain
MPTKPNAAIDVYVVGTGMVGYRQLTREVEAAFEQSNRILLVDSQDLVVEYLQESYDADVVDLREEYHVSEPRGDVYDRMAERTLDAAAAEPPVTLAVYGHPKVFVSPSTYITERAPDRDLNVEVRPGISAMDCMYAEFDIDPAANGMQMFEATDLLVREFDLNPEVPAMLWQVGTVESALHSTADSAPCRFTRLREHLQGFYPDDHEVSLLRASTYPVTESEQVSFPLSEFESMHDGVSPAHTLYVPPVRERPVQNETLESKVSSPEHLNRITLGDDDGR